MNYLGDRLALDLGKIVLRPADRDHHAELYFLGNSQHLAELVFHKHVERRESCSQAERISTDALMGTLNEKLCTVKVIMLLRMAELCAQS